MRLPLQAGVLLALLTAAASAQGLVTATFQTATGAATVPSGGTVSLTSPSVGTAVNGTITLTYTGTSRLTFPQEPQLIGSTDFFFQPPALPSLLPLQSVSFTVRYTPKSGLAAQAQFGVALQDQTSFAFFTLNLVGTVPQVVVSYVPPGSGSAVVLNNGDTVSFGQSLLNASTDTTFYLTNRGSAPSQVNSLAVTGSAFQLLNLTPLPVQLAPGSQIQFAVRFLPRAVGDATGSLQIGIDTQSIGATLSGTALRTGFSYTLTRNGTTTAIVPGGTIDLGDVPVGDRATAMVVVTNVLALPATLSLIAITGNGFSLTGGPVLPVLLQPQDSTSFQINFVLPSADAATGRLGVGNDSFLVTARSIGPSLRLSYMLGGISNPLALGSTVPFPGTAVGQKSDMQITIRNEGTGQFTAVSLDLGDPAAPFTLSDFPSLPVQIQPNESLTFTASFVPQTPGRATTTLGLNGVAILVLSGNTASGSTLQYSYRISNTDNSLNPGGIVPFPPTSITQTTPAQITVRNTGTSTGTLTSISLGAQTAFLLRDLPVLPLQLAPGATAVFAVDFKPLAAGSYSTTLSVDSTQFGLVGSAPSPPALPSYSFTPSGGAVQPFQQPALGLTLAAAYPIDLQGVLTLSTVSDSFAFDNSVRFANGAQTVTFRIPANQLQAQFPNGATQMPFQTGSLAGSLIITPAFATTTGVDLTPANPQTVKFDIPKLAPVLVAARMEARTLASFTLVLTGYSTTRTLQNLVFEFKDEEGNLIGKPTIDVTGSSRIWYQSGGSQALGGQFGIDIPFVLREGTDVSTSKDLVGLIKTITVQASNEVGQSNLLTTAP